MRQPRAVHSLCVKGVADDHGFLKKKEVYIRDTAFITIINAGPPEIIGGTASIHVEACIRGFTVYNVKGQ